MYPEPVENNAGNSAFCQDLKRVPERVLPDIFPTIKHFFQYNQQMKGSQADANSEKPF
jgi:hypothetical protein